MKPLNFICLISKLYLARFQMKVNTSRSLSPSILGFTYFLKIANLYLSINELSHVLKGDSNQNKNSENDVDKLIKVKTHGSGASGGNRAKLFRTPISCGVHSPTSVHGLPRPALAIPNPYNYTQILQTQLRWWENYDGERMSEKKEGVEKKKEEGDA
ncbi:hypothetical protein V6N11_026129 [Hibiscus sabdariffa]|uniref:Uncharacterized protein n=1 Tax=Hibiscus sabdariffa TaxID=183260 RepID=A0ABR2SVI0_9ROSI